MKLVSSKGKVVQQITNEEDAVINIGLKPTMEEQKVLEYFGLNSNFTREELENAYKNKTENKYTEIFNSNSESQKIEQRIDDYKKVAELFLYKKEKLSEALSAYNIEYNFDDNSYSVLTNLLSEYDLSLNKLTIADKYIRPEIMMLIRGIQVAKDESEVDKYTTDFIYHVNVFLIGLNQDKIISFETPIIEPKPVDSDELIKSYKELIAYYMSLGFFAPGDELYKLATSAYATLISYTKNPEKIVKEYQNSFYKLNEAIIDEPPKRGKK